VGQLRKAARQTLGGSRDTREGVTAGFLLVLVVEVENARIGARNHHVAAIFCAGHVLDLAHHAAPSVTARIFIGSLRERENISVEVTRSVQAHGCEVVKPTETEIFSQGAHILRVGHVLETGLERVGSHGRRFERGNVPQAQRHARTFGEYLMSAGAKSHLLDRGAIRCHVIDTVPLGIPGAVGMECPHVHVFYASAADQAIMRRAITASFGNHASRGPEAPEFGIAVTVQRELLANTLLLHLPSPAITQALDHTSGGRSGSCWDELAISGTIDHLPPYRHPADVNSHKL
jgi:hypothetical protein